MIIIDDTGFHTDPLIEATAAGHYRDITLDEALEAIGADAPAQNGLVTDVAVPVSRYAHLLPRFAVIKVPFRSFSDGRGFSVGIELRRAGYAGRLRAVGHLIPDQYAHARRCGYDEVAVTEEQAVRQPEAQWLAEVAKIGLTYQNRLRQAAHAA